MTEIKLEASTSHNTDPEPSVITSAQNDILENESPGQTSTTTPHQTEGTKEQTRNDRQDVHRRDEAPQKIESPEWGLKEIVWPPEVWEGQPQRTVKIVTQNANGPCSFIAICNILLLRGAITISPPDRRSASYEYLSMLIGDYLVNTSLHVDLEAVFSVLPKTQHGLDLNPLFTGIDRFRPAGAGGELKLFELAGIKLVHGWLVDPDSQEYKALSQTEDYDTSLDAVVAADILTSGQLVESEETDITVTAPKSPLSEEDHQKVVDALLIRQWLDSNSTQLTYYGLFALNDTPFIEPNELVCFFRSSHLNVLYKRKSPDSDTTRLYTLVTDRVFLREPSVVWEALVDVDGQASTFVDSYFGRSEPVGGDYAGQTSEQIARAYDQRENEAAMNLDLQLAHRLQLEEDEHARQVYEYRKQEQLRQREQALSTAKGSSAQQQSQPPGGVLREKKQKKKDKGDCIIM